MLHREASLQKKATRPSYRRIVWFRCGLVVCMATMFTVNVLVNFPRASSYLSSEEQSVYANELLSVRQMAPPTSWPLQEGSEEECLYSRDYGLLERLANTSQSFCTSDSNPINNSTFTVYSVPESGLTASHVTNFVLDVREAEVSRDIVSLENDGIDHDPRFKFNPALVSCTCADTQDAMHGVPNIWGTHFADFDQPWVTEPVCQPPSSNAAGDGVPTLTRAVIVSRRDDHNPFFQIAGIFNAWIMMNVLGWDRGSTQLVTLDRGLPSPIDELRHAILGPEHPVVVGEQLQSQAVHLESALLAPSEARGALMKHLDDDEPCYANRMLKDFRDIALKSMNVIPSDAKTDPQRCLVTVISRRPYGGRRIQRVWQNEEEILNYMREDYKDIYRFGECEFQSLDFVNMTMHDQMRTVLDSDVIIGMHGAGMVNVMWARPETLIVEIFPQQRYRWGYRNICQFLGCSWHEFRRGVDLLVRTSDPNDRDKMVPYAEWFPFFDPLFRDTIGRLENSTNTQRFRH